MRISRKILFGSAKPAAPRGHRAYVVGDVHGRLDLLSVLLDRIEDDVRKRKKMQTTIVFLGDLIDRGPDSAGVVELLRTYRPPFAGTMVLMGNHEEVMLRVLEGDGSLFARWMEFGGGECVRSYGLDPAELKKLPPDDAIAVLKREVPQNHVEFLASFADSVSFGSYLFVHAGIRPGTSFADQSQTDLRWIREPFLADERDHGHIVVHGHTICEQVEELPNRIALDTGAYRTGVLTALGLEGTERWFLQTDDAMVENGDGAHSATARAAGHK
ncbi:MAG: serine/threonine protein phosphatase [Pseudomonadota bacterium]|nr:serine/threonine protein phosphatase [Sphingomonas sp.]MDQ3477836.1 serine/threonine protein phosphatase [Pseudomonadota bacterium]